MTNVKVNNNYIRYQMKEKGISHSDLAKLLGCNDMNLYKTLEKTTVPTYTERLVMICHILDISLMDIFKIEE